VIALQPSDHEFVTASFAAHHFVSFPSYEAVSIVIYSLFYRTGAVIQAKSVDEAFLDLTHTSAAACGHEGTSGGTPDGVDDLVQRLRHDVFEQTGCQCSAGIGPSPLLARLATSKAKPNGQLRVSQAAASEFVLGMSVRDLPGIGWVQSKKLCEQGISTCAELRDMPLSALQSYYGDHTGRSFYDMSRGIDTRIVEPLRPRKSIGAEASWAVRFGMEDDEKVIKFVTDMANEVAGRCRAANATGRKITYKLYQMKRNAGRPGKFLGHGPCDIFTKSDRIDACPVELFPEKLASVCLRIHKSMNVACSMLRGLGIQVADLTFHSLMSARVAPLNRIDAFFSKSASHALAPLSFGASLTVNVEDGVEDGEEDGIVRRLSSPLIASRVDDLPRVSPPPLNRRRLLGPDDGEEDKVQPARKSRRLEEHKEGENDVAKLAFDGGGDDMVLPLPKNVQEGLSRRPKVLQTIDQFVGSIRDFQDGGDKNSSSNDDSDSRNGINADGRTNDDADGDGRTGVESDGDGRTGDESDGDGRTGDKADGDGVDCVNICNNARGDVACALRLKHRQELPDGWDDSVFHALPERIQLELLAASTATNRSMAGTVTHSQGTKAIETLRNLPAEQVAPSGGITLSGGGTSTRNVEMPSATAATAFAAASGAWHNSKAKRPAQATMTQLETVSRLKRRGNSVVCADEFRQRSIGECIELLGDLKGHLTTPATHRPLVSPSSQARMRGQKADEQDEEEIPPPPSLSINEPGVDYIVRAGEDPPLQEYAALWTDVGMENAMLGERVFAKENLASYAVILRQWMASTCGNVRSAHIELLRGRMLEMVQSRELELLFAEMSTMRLFAATVGGGWVSGFNVLLRDVQNEVQGVLALPLMIKGL
jgi:impB/mucB/samB family/impB/mucB/samB family C-terminal domain